ncbi:MAG: hypothetical protein QXV08_08615 [Desulfurococcus sp.]
MSLSANKERIESLLRKSEELIEESKKTDYRMPVILPFIPPILILSGAGLMVIVFIGLSSMDTHPGYLALTAMGFVIYILAILIAILLNFYIVYKWIKRRNDHFARTLMFFENLVEIADLLKFRRSHEMKSRLNELREINSHVKSALANTILTIIPLYIFYVYHFLNKDFAEHSEKEKLLLAEFFDEVREKIPSFTRRIEEFNIVPDRSTLLYLILTIIFPVFSIYWVYTLTKDPNKHFESHSVLERELVTALKQLLLQP